MLSIDSKYYVHDTDKSALNSLQAIPGFTPVLKAFYKIYNERQYMITNMSTNLKLGPNQFPEYYNMLPPICEKLGIEVPELYLELDVVPNAYTSGENKPFIVMTTGLLEYMPKELIPTILAHECGHIACHHVLYHNMGSMILNGSLAAMNMFGISKLISLPLEVAFFYWMRCSEYSADRAAIICDGGSEKLVEMCMRFSGVGKNFDNGIASKELFMQQAHEYRETVNGNAWNKTLEFFILKDKTHPLNAIRAYEADLWTKSEHFANVMAMLDNPQAFAPDYDPRPYKQNINATQQQPNVQAPQQPVYPQQPVQYAQPVQPAYQQPQQAYPQQPVYQQPQQAYPQQPVYPQQGQVVYNQQGAPVYPQAPVQPTAPPPLPNNGENPNRKKTPFDELKLPGV